MKSQFIHMRTYNISFRLTTVIATTTNRTLTPPPILSQGNVLKLWKKPIQMGKLVNLRFTSYFGRQTGMNDFD